MSLVKMTVQQLIDLDLWDKVLEYKGWNPYILNEGIIERDALVEFDNEFNKDDKDEAVKCGNCKENLITDMEIEYSKVTGEYFCSPDCATEYYFEYMESSPVCIDDRYDFKIRDNGVIYDMGKQ